MMTEFIRLKSYRSYFEDGIGYVEMSARNKKNVLIGIILGEEPKIIHNESERLDAEDVILRMADHIREARGDQIQKKRPLMKTAKKKVAKKKKASMKEIRAAKEKAKKKVKAPKKKIKRKYPKN
jgi:ribosomal protein L3